MAEQMEIDLQQSTISLRTIPDFNYYGLAPCPCCIDIKLTAPPYSASGETRAPIDLVTVIDRSGSMTGTKLDLVIKVLHFVAQHLKSIDRLAIVTYDNAVEELVSLANLTQKNRYETDAKISRIQSRGSTNLSGGLLKGMNIMNSRGEKADVASVLLFTDGMANSGITDTAGILTAMQNMFAGKKAFTVNTFGFGSDHNADMLKEISRVGNGLFYYIQNPDQIPEIFTNCLGGLLSTIGQDISVSVQTENGAVIKEILSKEKPKLSDGNKQGTVCMGDIQSEEERDILVELDLPQTDTPANQLFARVTLKYFNVIKKDNDQHQIEFVVDRRTDLSEREVSLEVDEQRNRIKTVASLARAAMLAEQGQLEEASQLLFAQRQYITNSSSGNSPRTSSLNHDLDRAVDSLSSREKYVSGGRSAIYSMKDSHISQRSTMTPSYSTPSRTQTHSSYVNASDPTPGLGGSIPCVDTKVPQLSTPPIPPKSQKRRSYSLKQRIPTPPPSEDPGDSKRDPAKGPPFISEL